MQQASDCVKHITTCQTGSGRVPEQDDGVSKLTNNSINMKRSQITQHVFFFCSIFFSHFISQLILATALSFDSYDILAWMQSQRTI